MSEQEDVTGRKRMAKNVAWSWLGHLVFVVSGFVMPRLIDRQLGQDLLGIWDFCWSIVNYLSLASLGIGSSVNRYVAKFRAANDHEQLCKTVSSVVAIQLLLALLVVLGTFLIISLLPSLFSARLGPYLASTRTVVFFLGASIAVQMAFDAFRGVVTGCHRWDLHNGLQSGAYAVTMVAMFVSMKMGGGIGSLAVIYFLGASFGEVLRVIIAFRVCPELKIGIRFLSWSHGRQMFVFGSKSLVLGVAPLIVFQTISIQLTAAMGPAALAVLMRPIGLVRHAETFLNKFTYVLSPIIGSLQGAGHAAQQREVFLSSSRWCVALALPSVLFLAIMGDPLLAVWMGPQYVEPGLITLIAGGLFLPMAQGPASQVMVGMNRHGTIGVICLVLVLVLLVGGSVLLSGTSWTLHRAALTVVSALALPYGVVLPLYACRRLEIPVLTYLKRAFLTPVACGSLFALVLLLCRILLPTSPLIALLVGAAMAGMVLAVLYWFFLLQESHRAQALAAVRRLRHER